ncbi:unnamed protein product, partial [Laminaria digitata]
TELGRIPNVPRSSVRAGFPTCPAAGSTRKDPRPEEKRLPICKRRTLCTCIVQLLSTRATALRIVSLALSSPSLWVLQKHPLSTIKNSTAVVQYQGSFLTNTTNRDS